MKTLCEMLNSNLISKSSFSIEILFLVIFVFLYTFWIVPDTLTIKYFCLFIGCSLSFYYFFKNSLKPLIPLSNILIIIFFIWVIIHYYFISLNPSLSLSELQSIQKRAFLSFIFAIGLSISIRRKNHSKIILCLFYCSLLGPLFFFFTTQYFFPEFFHLSFTDNAQVPYISKYQYVFAALFCVLWSMYLLIDAFYKKRELISFIAPLIFIVLSVFSFYKINGKNGMMYSAIAVLFFLFNLMLLKVKLSNRQWLYLGLPLFIALVLFTHHVQQNPTWKYLAQDLNMGWQTEQYENWKYKDGHKGILQNPSGVNVSLTTYERAAWFKEGSKLISNYPLGYGLIQDSFKYLAKEKWPDSEVFHTHSGWLDLILGFGIPGFICIFGAMLIAYFQCAKSQNYYAKSGTWVLPFMALAFLTSELCEKGSFELLIFVITFYGTISYTSHETEFHSALKN